MIKAYQPVFKTTSLGLPTNYPEIEGDTPFAKVFNSAQSEFWVRAGYGLDPDELTLQILMADFNERHSENNNGL